MIVGAGPNALVAAYDLPDVGLVCLEKEPRAGGNAQRSKWRGIQFTEGTAYRGTRSRLVDFPKEVMEWCNVYCATEFGYPRNLSATTGLDLMAHMGDYEGYATFPGGLAPMAEALAAGVRAQGANRI